MYFKILTSLLECAAGLCHFMKNNSAKYGTPDQQHDCKSFNCTSKF